MFVDTVYGSYKTYGGWYLIVASMLFTIQIYCDFYGYSVIAKGAAETLGIHLMENFNTPYLATSVADFWRGWHISLTSWFKDYLYIPLGGNRKSKLRKYLNKVIVFMISGLWHGTSLAYILWRGINGVYQVIGEVLQPVRNKAVNVLCLNRNSFGHKMMHVISTVLLVDFTWIFFRAGRLMESFQIIRQIKFVRKLQNKTIGLE